jgi:hypothetical protein
MSGRERVQVTSGRDMAAVSRRRLLQHFCAAVDALSGGEQSGSCFAACVVAVGWRFAALWCSFVGWERLVACVPVHTFHIATHAQTASSVQRRLCSATQLHKPGFGGCVMWCASIFSTDWKPGLCPTAGERALMPKAARQPPWGICNVFAAWLPQAGCAAAPCYADSPDMTGLGSCEHAESVTWCQLGTLWQHSIQCWMLPATTWRCGQLAVYITCDMW